MLRASELPPGERKRRPLFAGASLSAAAQICTALTGALVGLLLARTLGPSGLGSYNLLVSLMVLLVAAGTCGVDFGASFLVSRREWSPAEAARQIQVGALILGVAAFAMGCVVFLAGRSTVFAHLDLSDVLLLLSCLPFAISMQITASLAVAVEKYELAAAGPAVQSAISLILVAVLASSFGLTGAVGGFVGSYIFTGIGLARRMPRGLGPAPRDWPRSVVRMLRRAGGFGFGVSLTNALGQLVQRVDLFILSAFVSAATLGKYSLAFGLTSVQLLLPRALGQVILPRVASLGLDAGDQHAVAQKGLRHAVILTTGTALVMAVLLPLVPLLYGKDFGATVPLAEALVPGVAVAGLTSVMAPLLVAHGFPKDVTALGVGGLAIACCFYASLIPLFGAWGAAVSSTISYVILGLLYAWALRRRRVVDALSDWLPRRADFRDYTSLARGLRGRRQG
jgi:O-antigen/teichoic acid export membrane protein